MQHRNPVARSERLQYLKAQAISQIHAEELMAWTTPTLVEICIGLEINGYLPAEF